MKRSRKGGQLLAIRQILASPVFLVKEQISTHFRHKFYPKKMKTLMGERKTKMGVGGWERVEKRGQCGQASPSQIFSESPSPCGWMGCTIIAYKLNGNAICIENALQGCNLDAPTVMEKKISTFKPGAGEKVTLYPQMECLSVLCCQKLQR